MNKQQVRVNVFLASLFNVYFLYLPPTYVIRVHVLQHMHNYQFQSCFFLTHILYMFQNNGDIFIYDFKAHYLVYHADTTELLNM
jgi:cytochrome b subunit of formate dehydrogenase